MGLWRQVAIGGTTVIRINVLFLGPAKDLADAETTTIEIAGAVTVADLREVLSEEYEGLRPMLGLIRFAVNETFAGDDTVLRNGDEVALIPPVSGGQDTEPRDAGPTNVRPTFQSVAKVESVEEQGTLVQLVSGPIPVDRIRDFVMGDPELGGIVTFEGATRREKDPQHGVLVRLEYEAYEGMARRQLKRLAVEAKRRWSAGRVAIIHRLGAVAPGEVSVMISVACPHRAEAFEACRRLIDTLKRDVPIWKKDVFEDGYVRWVQASREQT